MLCVVQTAVAQWEVLAASFAVFPVSVVSFFRPLKRLTGQLIKQKMKAKQAIVRQPKWIATGKKERSLEKKGLSLFQTSSISFTDPWNQIQVLHVELKQTREATGGCWEGQVALPNSPSSSWLAHLGKRASEDMNRATSRSIHLIGADRVPDALKSRMGSNGPQPLMRTAQLVQWLLIRARLTRPETRQRTKSPAIV